MIERINEVLGQLFTERFNVNPVILPRDRIDRVLDRVGGYDLAVVASEVRFSKLPSSCTPTVHSVSSCRIHRVSLW